MTTSFVGENDVIPIQANGFRSCHAVHIYINTRPQALVDSQSHSNHIIVYVSTQQRCRTLTLHVFIALPRVTRINMYSRL